MFYIKNALLIKFNGTNVQKKMMALKTPKLKKKI